MYRDCTVTDLIFLAGWSSS